jgi:Lipocalin-like domain
MLILLSIPSKTLGSQMIAKLLVKRSALAGVAVLAVISGCSSKAKSATGTDTAVTVVAESVVTEPETTNAATDAVTDATAQSTSAADPIPLLSGGGQRAWYITERITNGGAPELPVCAKDDELIFDNRGGFISVISGTQCNPSEADVPNGTYTLSTDKRVITFTTPGLSYPGTIIELTDAKMVLEFDLGPGFVIRDSFAKR